MIRNYLWKSISIVMHHRTSVIRSIQMSDLAQCIFHEIVLHAWVNIVPYNWTWLSLSALDCSCQNPKKKQTQKINPDFHIGPIHLPYLRIRKWLYGQLESYRSVSTYRWLETYGPVKLMTWFFEKFLSTSPILLNKYILRIFQKIMSWKFTDP